MVRKRHRLRLLQMGKSWHISLHMLLHNRKERLQKFLQQTVCIEDFQPCVQPHIERHLIVAAPSRMQFLARIPDPLRQIRLHKTVNIFVLLCNLQLSRFHI